ncbi:T9SS type A sorting domain-containing protein [Owenweeksia hongkongensis]|uniref:T9SS type A sorting domain-containing protein n=1 Tax=Owenweeksia hongkongensis TaxID=253245 RepID=UPI003A8EBEDF
MKKNNPILLVLLTLITTTLSAQWIATDGPYGRVQVYDIERTDSLLFASTYSGVFVKKDGETRWKSLSREFTPKMYMKGDSLYTSFYHGRAIVQTTSPKLDVINFPYGSVPFINGPSFAFLDSVMYITSSEGIYISLDAGATASQFTTGLDMDTSIFGSNTYISLPVFDVITADTTVYCSTTNGVYSSDNTLTTWQKKNSGLEHTIIRNLNAGPSGIYAISYDSLYFSSDNGNSWSSIFGGGVGLGGVCEASGNIYLAADTMGVLVSSDGGNQWQAFNNGIANKQVSLVKYVDGELYCAIPDDGLYHWNGVQWVAEPKEGMIVTVMRSTAKTSTGMFALDVNKGVFKYQSDNTWQNVSPPQSDYSYFNDILEKDDTLFTLVTEYDFSTGRNSLIIYHSSDDGQSWQYYEGPGYLSGVSNGLMRYYKGGFYIFNSGNVFRTFNKGQSWEDITSNACYGISDLAYFNNELYLAGCDVNRVRKYDESLGTWVLDPDRFLSGHTADAFFQRDTFLFVNSYYGVHRRSVNSTSWTDLSNGFATPVYTSDFLNVGDNLFVVSAEGVMYTNDYGVSWNSMTDSVVTGYGCVDVDVFNDTLFLAVYGQGVYKHVLPLGSVSLPNAPVLNDAVKLYPNPATDNITIALKDASGGTYKLLDQGGKVLVSGDFENGKKLELPNLSEGLYFINILGGEEKYLQKLIIKK